MPIYDYRCAPCGHVFEELVLRKGDEEALACPSCRSGQVARVPSRTAAARITRGGGGPPPPCGPVG
jgi:putative FmdB family regulatory protein